MRTLTITLLMLLSYVSHAQHSATFIENKGQWDEQVHFKTPLTNGAFFLKQNGFTVVQHDGENLNNIREAHHHPKEISGNPILRSHAYEVNFTNSLSPVIIQEEVQSSYHNYFLGNDPSQWSYNCKVSAAVLYQDVYSGIDMRFASVTGAIKYDLIVKPGASVAAVSLEYKGADKLLLSEGKLLISTSTGTLQEFIPDTYTIRNGKKTQVQCHYVVEGNFVSFNVGAYNVSDTLIIDPQLVFSSYTGSTADNWANTAAYAADGSFFSGGIAFNTGFPATTGAFQTTFNGGSSGSIGGYDVCIMKFSANGTANLYATYLGGSSNETPLSLFADAQGNLVIAGRTLSSNFPVTQTLIGSGGAYDIFITKLNSAGSALVGSRVIGGGLNDGVNIRPTYDGPQGTASIRRHYGDDNRGEVFVDGAGNVIFAGCTQSFQFPTTPGAFQTTFGGGVQDGVLLKFDADLSTLIFSSFIGGSADDGAFSVAVNTSNNNIYVAGSTTSTNLPGIGTAVISGTFSGGATDGFISSIDGTGSTILNTTYLGTSGNDMLYFVRVDNANNPYVTGTTTGLWNVINAAFNQANGKQFIAKLQPDLSDYIYSTVFGKGGGTPDISPIAFGVDNCENVYVAGWGGTVNTNGSYPASGTFLLPVTTGALQTGTDGDDFYFFVLNKDAASQRYGTYFGRLHGQQGDHNDGGTNRFDHNGTLYLAACVCEGGTNPFPITAGAWSTNSGRPAGCNLAAVKFEFGYCSTSMPVKLKSFTSVCTATKTTLYWNTENEQNSHRFEVEKNLGNGTWKKIGSVQASNNITGSNYEYTDTEGGIALYRLKQIDNDGRFTFSNVITNTCLQRNKMYVYPIPAKEQINISITADKRTPATLQLIDVAGKIILQTNKLLEKGANNFGIYVSNVAKGHYLLRMTTEDKIETASIIIIGN